MEKECIYDYQNSCTCSEDNKCGCDYDNNMAGDFLCNFDNTKMVKTTRSAGPKKSTNEKN
ncbi:MAG: hypothetical protein J6S61_00030 [Elusimicrobiaceae bacterium]|nr:hypothetical protein [Elusimicrobiaceae bacterium]